MVLLEPLAFAAGAAAAFLGSEVRAAASDVVLDAARYVSNDGVRSVVRELDGEDGGVPGRGGRGDDPLKAELKAHRDAIADARGGALPEDDSLPKASTFAAQTLLEVTKRL